MEQPIPYQAYLIRLWPVVRGGVAGCRVSLQCVATGERRDLPDLESLLAFLQAQGDESHTQRGLDDDCGAN